MQTLDHTSRFQVPGSKFKVRFKRFAGTSGTRTWNLELWNLEPAL